MPSTDSLLQSLYNDLRQVAQRQLSGERVDHTLQATASVNEAYLRLSPDRVEDGWGSKSQFLRAASEAMRRILVDHARQTGRETQRWRDETVASRYSD